MPARHLRYRAAALTLVLVACNGDGSTITSTPTSTGTTDTTITANPPIGSSTTAPITIETTTTLGEVVEPVVNLVETEGMTLADGPVTLAGVVATEAGSLLVAGSRFEAASRVRLPTAWEGPDAATLTASTLPGIEPGAAGAVSAVAGTGSVTLLGGSSSRSGESRPVVWERDDSQWQLLELPAAAVGSTIAVDAAGPSGDRYAAVTSSADGRALWLLSNGDWQQATGFPFLDDAITGIVVTDDRIVIAAFDDDTALLASTADGSTYDVHRIPGARVLAMADDGSTIVAAGSAGRSARAPAMWRSSDGATWEEVDAVPAGALGRGITGLTHGTEGFVATSQFEMWASADGSAWRLLDEAAIPGGGRAVFVGPAILAVTGGSVATLTPGGWELTSLGPEAGDAPRAVATAAAGGVLVVAGRNAPGTAHPIWRSTDPGRWELLDAGWPIDDLTATATGFAAVSLFGDGVVLLTSDDGRIWDGSPVELAASGFFPAGIAAHEDTILVFGNDAEIDGVVGGAVVVWSDGGADPATVRPEPFVNTGDQFTTLDALCAITHDVWVAFGTRQQLGGDAAGTEVLAATTDDAGVTWAVHTVRTQTGSFAYPDGCVVTSDDRVVVWGSYQRDNEFGSWMATSLDPTTWVDGGPVEIRDGSAVLTTVARFGAATVAFGADGSAVSAWTFEGAGWRSLAVPGLAHPPLSAASDGERVVLHGNDGSQAVVYESRLTDVLGG